MSPAALITGQHLPIPFLPQSATARSNALDSAVALLFVCLPLLYCPDSLHLMPSRLTLPPFIDCQTLQPMTFFAHILPLVPANCAAFLFVPFLPHFSSFFIMPFLSASICRPTSWLLNQFTRTTLIARTACPFGPPFTSYRPGGAPYPAAAWFSYPQYRVFNFLGA